MAIIRDRLLLLIFGLLFVAFGIITALSLYEERSFINGAFNDWIETDAVIGDYMVTVSEPVKSGRDYKYTVKYEFTISFDTADGRISLERSVESNERTTTPEDIDDTFYAVPPGSVRTLCYDPAKPEDNRWGGKDDIIKAATSPLRLLMCFLLGAIGLFIIWLAIKPLVQEKLQKKTWHGTQEE